MDGSTDKAFQRQPRSGGFLYWSLTLMGMATFVPCIVLPEWRDYGAVYSLHEARAAELASFEHTVREEQRRLAALQADPAAIARLAQRELSLRRTGERSVVVRDPIFEADFALAASLDTPKTHAETSYAGPPVPAPLAAWLGALPALDFDALFCDDQTRRILMILSLGLILTAFLLFGRRSIPAGASIDP